MATAARSANFSRICSSRSVNGRGERLSTYSTPSVRSLSISVKSRPGQGALFSIELPVTAPSEGVSETREVAPPRIGGKAILVVDDEPDVAAVLADMLALDGHHVATAANGGEALEKLNAGTYNLVLSDMKMPGLDGPGLYREIERSHPVLLPRCVFLTGDMLSRETREFFERTGVPTVSKPFTQENIRQAVHQILRVPELAAA